MLYADLHPRCIPGNHADFLDICEDEQYFEIENWLQRLNEAFIELAALRIRDRYKTNSSSGAQRGNGTSNTLD